MEGPWRPSWPGVTRREVHNGEERPWRSEPQARHQQGSGGALGIGNNRSVWGKIMTQEFTQALDKAVGQATFEILDSGIRITAVEPRGFSRTHPALLGLAQAQMPADSLDDLTGLLPSLLRNHIKGDRVGDGLAFFLIWTLGATVTTSTGRADSPTV